MEENKCPTKNLMDKVGIGRITFVVLHYLAYEASKECVESILDLPKYDSVIDIVVVDNASANGSFEKLQNDFKDNCIHFIHNNDNLGFARGMNIGYRYAREQLNANVIILMNNDLIIEQKSFLAILSKVVSKGFDVIGPDIVTGNNLIHTNPQTPEKNYFLTYLRYFAIKSYFLCMPDKIGLYIYGKFRSIVNTNTDKRISNSNESSSYESENVQLQGACLIFANKFISQEAECLDNRTFLYHEEDLLFQYCMRKKYHILYTPDLQVYHKGGVGTKQSAASFRMRKINNLKYHMQSIRYVMSDIKKYGRKYPRK